MRYQPQDSYKVKCDFDLSESLVQRLVLLYQPLTGLAPVSLYLTMAAEAGLNRGNEPFERLAGLLCGMTAEAFDGNLAVLEEHALVKVYQRVMESRSMYLFELQPPLGASAFLETGSLWLTLQSNVGMRQAENSLHKLNSTSVSVNGYRDITRLADTVRIGMDYAVNYQKVRPAVQFHDDEIDIRFDYDKFFAAVTKLTFPIEERTTENLRLIGRLATIYGLSPEKMCVLVMKACTALDENRRKIMAPLDQEKLIRLAEKEKPDENSEDDPYALPPVSFLHSRQKGAAVTLADKKVIEKLSLEMNFPNEVINTLVEYVLEESDNRLVGKFVDMVAGQWARENVRTRQEALQQVLKARKLKKNTGWAGYKKKSYVPQYIYDQEQGNYDQETADDTTLAEIRRHMSEEE